MAQAGEDLDFLTLEYQMGDAGTNADGEYAWPYQDSTNHLTHLRNFYLNRAQTLQDAAGVAYPGFHDFYQQGGAGSTLFYIPENNGQTLTSTLNTYNTFQNVLDMLQLATFNDFGEGTMFEPTVETGFEYLKQIQQFTGVSYGEAELQLVYRLYLARKEYATNPTIAASLDQVASMLNNLDVAGATSLLNTTARPGDYNGDGLVDFNDYGVWRGSTGASTILYGSGADGNYDGAINAADYVVWRNDFSAGGAGTNVSQVPEPATFSLMAIAALLCGHGVARRCRQR
jgi:hypothetical protein